jgi:hypothetical protein
MTDPNALPPILRDWLLTDEVVPPASSTPYLPKNLDQLSTADREAVLDWLGVPPSEHEPPPADPAQQAAVAWLLQARTILASEQLSAHEKIAKLRAARPEASALALIKRLVGATLGGYGRLPVGLRVALPATLLAAPVLGGTGVGIAAFGGAIGLPALLVFFLGVSGLTSLIAALLDTDDDNAIFVQGILALLATDAALMRLKAATRTIVVQDITTPRRHPMPDDPAALRARWLALSPLEFEQHVMSLFVAAGLTAWVTPAGSDAGIDGVAKDGERLILVQCKRYASENPVSRPAIQQFKGVIEENGADLGVFVTTSGFTAQALESAGKSERLLLVGPERLARWQTGGLSLES